MCTAPHRRINDFRRKCVQCTKRRRFMWQTRTHTHFVYFTMDMNLKYDTKVSSWIILTYAMLLTNSVHVFTSCLHQCIFYTFTRSPVNSWSGVQRAGGGFSIEKWQKSRHQIYVLEWSSDFFCRNSRIAHVFFCLIVQQNLILFFSFAIQRIQMPKILKPIIAVIGNQYLCGENSLRKVESV